MSPFNFQYAEISNRPYPLGVTLVDGGVNVALFADNATAVDFCVREDDGSETRWRLPDKARGIWHGFVPGITPGTRYGFRVHGEWNPAEGQRHNPHKFLVDPYAKAIDGDWIFHPAVFGYRLNSEQPSDESVADTHDSAPFVPSSIVVANDFDWSGDVKPDIRWHRSVIYEAHVKGMTMLHPLVPEHLRGTYAGLSHEAVIEYLLSLGVTAIELLPIHQIGHEEHLLRNGLTNYWGYNTLGYFAPHHAYSSAGTRGEQVNEFKQMVKSFHQAGIEVLLDVVYNHTCEGGPRGPMLSFKGIDNANYYRLADDPQFYFDTTGCSNTLNTWHPQVMQLVMDSLRYWVEEMHVDGFRFDLAPALARMDHDVDMRAPLIQAMGQDPVLQSIKLIAEPWDIGPGGYQVGNFPRIWSEWNDRFRDTTRDFWRGAAPGIAELASRLSGSADLFVDEDRRPRASINYVTAHDGFTMWDVLSYNHKHNQQNLENNNDGSDSNRSWNHGHEGETTNPAINALRMQQHRNLLATLTLASGIPMIVAGDELGRTQHGNNNPYCQDNEISWIDWTLTEKSSDLLETARHLMHLRKTYPAFRHRNYRWGAPTNQHGVKDIGWFAMNGDELSEQDWLDTELRTLGMFLCQNAYPSLENSEYAFFVIFHADDEVRDFTLPNAEWVAAWHIEFDSTHPGGNVENLTYQASEVLRLQPRSLLVFRQVLVSD